MFLTGKGSTDDEIISRPECSKSSRMNVSGTRFMPKKTENEEKTDISNDTSSKGINFTSAQNFHPSQKGFAHGTTLEDYFKGHQYQLNPMNPKITEQSELSFDNSEKKYLEASFEINESDEDVYTNSDSNSSASKPKKIYEKEDNVKEPNQEQEELKNKIKEKYNGKKPHQKQSNYIEEKEYLPLRDQEGRNSLTSIEKRENRMKNIEKNKKPKKNYNSQSPPHSDGLQKGIERRNFSKDAFAKQYSHEDKLQSYNSKENIENHIAYRNSYDPNKTQFCCKREENPPTSTRFGNFHNNPNNDFNKSSYNSKSRLTLNEFYKHQSKYQEFSNPIGPPRNNENVVEKKYCDKQKITEKIKSQDLLTKYASKFKLNEES